MIDNSIFNSRRCYFKGIKRMVMFIAYMSLLILISCGFDLGLSSQFDKDVSGNKEFWGGYELAKEYEITRYVFLEKKRDWTEKFVLVPPGNQENLGRMIWTAPASREEYIANKTNWPDVVGIIDEGTIIRIQKFGQHGAPLWSSSIYVIAEVMNGPSKGRVVDIGDISLVYSTAKEPYPLKPDTRILKKIENPRGHPIIDQSSGKCNK